jgi:uncharacterized protein (DUF2345 family)
MRDANEHELLRSVHANRLNDLALRSAAGHLTAAESLALAILRGGREGEEGVPALIDAAQEEYGHGGYRVPVRCVADWSRCLLVLTMPKSIPLETQEQATTTMSRVHHDLVANKRTVLTLQAGFKLEVYEVAPGEPAGVTVKEAPK